jgi:hypothetical protein
VGAIWITDARGRFIKTLELWADRRREYLVTFEQEAQSSIDAVTSATLVRHAAHVAKWDFTDARGAIVPDGDYQVVVEMTDHNSAGDLLRIPFNKGKPLDRNLADAQHFSGMSIHVE